MVKNSGVHTKANVFTGVVFNWEGWEIGSLTVKASHMFSLKLIKVDKLKKKTIYATRAHRVYRYCTHLH